MTVDTRPDRETGGQKQPGHGPGRLMSARDIQQELGVKQNAAWRIIQALGRTVRIGRSVYVHREDVESYLEQNTEVTSRG